MFLKKPQYRRFEYAPRFYHPERDPAEQFRHRFEAERKGRSRKTRPILFWGIILVLILYAYLLLSGALKS